MIDVVFLLIIFFMATAQFARLTRAEVDLPIEPGEQKQSAEEAGIVVNITKDGTIIVAEQVIHRDDFRAFLEHQMRQRAADAARTGDRSEIKLLLRADRESDSSILNHVVTELQHLGVNAARIATEVPGVARTSGGGS